MKNHLKAKAAEHYMRQCLLLAAQTRGEAFPNPMVGAVIVKDNKIIGQGAHYGPGTPHAEIIALKQAGQKAKDATLYVNLEPCCHFGNTPPCTDAIIKAQIKQVVFAIKDPNPLVKKRNSKNILEKAGIKVNSDILGAEAKKINEVFLKYHQTKKPFVVLKLAATLDGKIATTTGNSKWITGEESRQFVQLLRREAEAILVGINTIIRDNPELTIRNHQSKKIRQPLRVILDSKLRLPLKAKVLNLKSKGATLIFTTKKAKPQKIKDIRNKGVEVVVVKTSPQSQVSLKEAVRYLAKRQITSILIEGGSEVAASAIKNKLVDKLYYFIAPKLIGGRTAVPTIGDLGINKLKQAYNIKDLSVEKIGEDLLVQGYFY
ncbi:MAG: bifunctional diaminohydroxyphosphoribosylaminopyrimidine deaminase/5-amino-6-(5-phosphoribosylamino)uracil reductase RibD [Candidatus Margulisbacteria bacterium]|nr:bifunctional diaminohydroxyphosphoribosylaminopyrimidine deaminase/5-amino-6-(5-phosphoribosylamino)uracil reductase RibD [Candidatus Margulisiibacteriota bacterium]